MRILILATNRKEFVYDTRWREQQALVRVAAERGWELILYGPGFDYWTSNVREVVGKLKDEGRPIDAVLCVAFERPLIEPLDDKVVEQFSLPENLRSFPTGLHEVDDVPKVLWINDFWHLQPEEWNRALFGHGFSYVIGTFAPPFVRESTFQKTYSEDVRAAVTFYPCPRSIDPELFKDYGEQRSVDVSLLGSLTPDMYPLRVFFDECLQNQSWLSYLNVSHPGYKYNPTEGLFGEAYARALARSKIFVGCTSRFNIPFTKIYEATACGALLFCDRPSGAEELGLVDGETYVRVDRGTFVPKLQYYLQHEDERVRIADAGRQLCHTRHTVEVRAGETLDTLARIVEAGPRTVGDAAPVDPRAAGRKGGGARVSRTIGRKVRAGYRRVRHSLRVLLRGVPPYQNPLGKRPFAPVKGGSCLDWRHVEETAHIIQLASITSRRELELIQWLGLNARWNPQPKLTPHPEVRALRPIFLRRLATAIRARLLCEVGTARGLQAVFFAEHLAFGSAGEGWVYTCDVTGHDEPKYYTPFSDEKVWTRRELWSSQPISSMITFVHGDSASLASRLRDDLGDERIDLLFIDAVHTEKAVLNDYHNLLPLISENTVIVFDDCDPCFPGVERAVAAIAEERAAGVQLVDFWPAPYRVAIMGNPLRLSKLMRKDAAPEGMGAPLSV